MPLSTLVTPLFLLLLCCVLSPGQKLAIDVSEPGRKPERILAERVPEGFRISQEGQWVVVPQEKGRLSFNAAGERVDLEGNVDGLETPLKSERLVLKVKDGSTFNVTRTGRDLTLVWSADPNVRIEVKELP